MGKVLLEKLLYSCTELKEIVILMRPKRGKSEAERVADFINIPLFQRIVDEKPWAMNKIVPVYGDITKSNLGLNETHLEKVLQCQLVFHVAASLRLEWTLKPNIEINLIGTKNTIELAKKMTNLLLMVHFSTAFCCVEEEILDERVIDWPDKPEDLIRCAEWMSEETLASMQKSILKVHPNTYTYTKRLTEILIRDEYANGFPVCIIRPSVVVPSYQEPFPGWVDNLNGPAGLMLGAAKGVIRSMLLDGDLDAEVIPVDVAINTTILIAKHVASAPMKADEVEVFNVSMDPSKRRPMKEILEIAKKYNYEYTIELGLWYPDGVITTNKFYHKFNLILFHWLPAYFIDFLMLMLMQKRFMVRIQNRISQGLDVLHFFTMRRWNFKCDKIQSIIEIQTPSEYKMFFIDSKAVPDEASDEYIKNAFLGGRQYVLKEPLSTIPRAKVQMKM